MGSKENGDEQPIHRVKITKPFYLGVYPVTQGEYERITGTNPSRFKGDARLPVEQVSWEDAVNFAQRLSQQEGNRKYRLPSEAEWEYACRAGTTTAYWFGDALNGDRANVNGNSPFGTDKKGPYRQKTTVVDTFAANPFGLYDMHGNVWEWCRDWYDANYYKRSPIEDPVNETESQYRVLRGGSWGDLAWDSRSAGRFGLTPSLRNSDVGVRVVCELR
jgi:formylglycine-generating enzyme required for sulfatase activity